MTRVVLALTGRLRRTPSPSKPHLVTETFPENSSDCGSIDRGQKTPSSSKRIRNSSAPMRAEARTRSLLGPINVAVHCPPIAQRRPLTHH